MNAFLDELSKAYPDDEILLICDGAAWHKSYGLKKPPNIRIVRIPPYTPEMNPIEQICMEPRKRWFRNEVLDTLADVVNRFCKTINGLPAKTIRSIKGHQWIAAIIYWLFSI